MYRSSNARWHPRRRLAPPDTDQAVAAGLIGPLSLLHEILKEPYQRVLLLLRRQQLSAPRHQMGAVDGGANVVAREGDGTQHLGRAQNFRLNERQGMSGKIGRDMRRMISGRCREIHSLPPYTGSSRTGSCSRAFDRRQSALSWRNSIAIRPLVAKRG
ncbi:hypothetical protein VTK73DRAFT_8759 [Phialemonium thermophilum]|uniref:Uncharacterized protein n=1 Tax=Phialemonium thermophilum TaxID=223376 RepID=A0ABR3W6D6_9PEZI